jgi:hypothetical protein
MPENGWPSAFPALRPGAEAAAGFRYGSATRARVIGEGFLVYIPTRSLSGYIHPVAKAEDYRPATINALHLSQRSPRLHVQLVARPRHGAGAGGRVQSGASDFAAALRARRQD